MNDPGADRYILFCGFMFVPVNTLVRLILASVKFCDFEMSDLACIFFLANSWKISELEKMVSDMVFSECDCTCVKLKRESQLA